MRRLVRRPLLAALAATACAASLSAAPAQAAPAVDRAAPQQLRITQVYGASTAIETGTQVRTSTEVRSVTRTRQPERVVRLYLVGQERAYNLTVATTPSLAPGARAVVRTTTRAPLSVPAGRYAVRACFGPSGSQVCRASRSTVVIGVARLTASPSSLDFGSSPVGGPEVTREVTITNTGHTPTGPFGGAGIGQGGSGTFDLDEDTCEASLAPGQSCTATVSYAPGEAPGTAEGELVLQSSSARVSVDLTARTASAAGASRIDPSSYDYGDLAIGSSASTTFRFVNDTDTDSQLISGNFGDDSLGFSFDLRDGENSCLSFVIPARGSCTFSVGFAPQREGTVSTTVTFEGTGLDPATAVLTGTGTPGGGGDPSDRSEAPRPARSYLAGAR